MVSPEFRREVVADFGAKALFVWWKAEIHDRINYTAQLPFVMPVTRQWGYFRVDAFEGRWDNVNRRCRFLQLKLVISPLDG